MLDLIRELIDFLFLLLFIIQRVFWGLIRLQRTQRGLSKSLWQWLLLSYCLVCVLGQLDRQLPVVTATVAGWLLVALGVVTRQLQKSQQLSITMRCKNVLTVDNQIEHMPTLSTYNCVCVCVCRRAWAVNHSSDSREPWPINTPKTTAMR